MLLRGLVIVRWRLVLGVEGGQASMLTHEDARQECWDTSAAPSLLREALMGQCGIPGGAHGRWGFVVYMTYHKVSAQLSEVVSATCTTSASASPRLE